MLVTKIDIHGTYKSKRWLWDRPCL